MRYHTAGWSAQSSVGLLSIGSLFIQYPAGGQLVRRGRAVRFFRVKASHFEVMGEGQLPFPMLKSLLKSMFYRFGYSICRVRPVGALNPSGATDVSGAADGRLMPLIHAVSPYQDFPLDDYPEDLYGWGSQSAAFDELVERVKPSRIIEVGTWKGGSAIHLATVARKLGLAPEIICVDTWLGAVEFWTDQTDPERYLALKCRHGYPTVYYQFVANVIHRKCEDLITPFPQTATIAALWFRRHGVTAGMIYIDGSHEEEDVYADLVSYWDLLQAGGILVGDDWGWDGVRIAATRFAREQGLEVRHLKDKWLLEKAKR